MRLTSNPNHDDRERRLEPLPGDFSPDLQAIDERLAELAAQSVVRSDLSQRVFAASVQNLPANVGGNRNLRFVDRVWGGRQAWGQFAMAASVAIAFGIALWFVQGPHTNPINNVATLNSDVDVSVVSMLRHLPAEPSHLENEFDYLLETSDLTSPDEITSELAMLVREMEM
jgi:anti-sigma-K factor RskA